MLPEQDQQQKTYLVPVYVRQFTRAVLNCAKCSTGARGIHHEHPPLPVCVVVRPFNRDALRSTDRTTAVLVSVADLVVFDPNDQRVQLLDDALRRS